MANGLGTLERFFTMPRRKDRGRQNSTQQYESSTAVAAQRPSSPMFPSPSFLRPTSRNMAPRDAQTFSREKVTRNMSIPQDALSKRSSGSSGVTIVNRSGRSEGSSSLRRRSGLSTASRPPRFRFPEDSLFKNDRSRGREEVTTRKEASREPSPKSQASKPQTLLDWSPKHVSLLFNPLEFEASSDNFLREERSDSTASTLLPSPVFAHSKQSSISHDFVDKVAQPGVSYPPTLPYTPSIHIGQQCPLSGKTLIADSPPNSPCDNKNQKHIIHRSKSLASVAPLSPTTTCTTTINTPMTSANRDCRERQTIRETWGSRLEDPQLISRFSPRRDEEISRSIVRKSASMSTFSPPTPLVSQGGVLAEPTFDDFFALSDDDIAESRPPTPDPSGPPTPPPKDTPDLQRKRHPPRVLTSQRTPFKPKLEEITPPDTPTDGHLLTLTYTPSNPRDALGALWAAELASKYDFAVVYVMSLWPVDGDRHLDVSTPVSPRESQLTNATATQVSSASTEGPTIGGRLLAAYGLNEVPSPFEIVTDTHLSALDCDYWNEYRNVDARQDDISRGWIRPFYSDYVPVSSSLVPPGNPAGSPAKNRGIVFAAYSKYTRNPIIPMRACPEQEFRLRQLYLDAKTLVEALVQPSLGSNKASTFRQSPGSSGTQLRLPHVFS